MALFEVKPVDHGFYAQRLRDFLPDSLFDVHTHVFLRQPPAAHGRTVSWPGWVAASDTMEELEQTASLLFPGKAYTPLIFGSPDDNQDVAKANAYVHACSAARGVPALMLMRPETPPEDMEAAVLAGGFRGIKAYLSYAPAWIPAGEIRIFDFLPHGHLEVCDRHGWAVMLHIPRPLRLRDPVNIAQLLQIEDRYRGLKLIVAHVGRAYCRSDVGEALDILAGTRNMLFDISANTNNWVFERLIKAVGSARILYGSDLPITRMRMRRMERDGTYVNLVPRGLYGDVGGDPNMGELDPPESDALSFFLYEQIEAFRQAALRTRLRPSDIEGVFRKNAAALFG